MAGMMQYNFSSHSNAGSGWNIDTVTVYHPQACRSRLLSRYVRLRQQSTASMMNPSGTHAKHVRVWPARLPPGTQSRTTMNTPPRPEVGLITCRILVPRRSGNETSNQDHGRGTRHFLKYPYISGKFPPAPSRSEV